jgi:hypothetical protein
MRRGIEERSIVLQHLDLSVLLAVIWLLCGLKLVL